MFKSLGNMLFGDDEDEEGTTVKRGVPLKLSIVYGKSTYELEFTEDDFSNEENPRKGLTVLSLKFIVSRILTPKILLNDVANNGSTVAENSANNGSKLINPNNFMLIHQGRKLKDDTKYLVDYRIKTGDKILVMVSNPERVAAAAAAASRSSSSTSKSKTKTSKSKKESTGVSDSNASSSTTIPRKFPVKPLTPEQEIQKVLDQLDREVVPLITKFIANPPETEAARKEEHHRISE